MNTELRDLLTLLRIFLDAIASKYCDCAKGDKEAQELKSHASNLIEHIDDYMNKNE